jgi:magnesium chelatase family protein
MNPCPCGHAGSRDGRCTCTAEQVARYRRKLSGPLLDRMDVVIEVPLLGAAEMQDLPAGEPSAVVRERVARAWQVQQTRQAMANSRLAPAAVDRLCTPDATGRKLLAQAIERLRLSARAYHRILKVARTIADLAGTHQIGATHVAEAIQYRRNLEP